MKLNNLSFGYDSFAVEMAKLKTRNISTTLLLLSARILARKAWDVFIFWKTQRPMSVLL